MKVAFVIAALMAAFVGVAPMANATTTASAVAVVSADTAPQLDAGLAGDLLDDLAIDVSVDLLVD
jgi:hypothetical protein